MRLHLKKYACIVAVSVGIMLHNSVNSSNMSVAMIVSISVSSAHSSKCLCFSYLWHYMFKMLLLSILYLFRAHFHYMSTDPFCLPVLCHVGWAMQAASEMTYIVSGGALNSTHSLTGSWVMYSVRRRGKNVDSSSKSNTLRRRGKKLRRVDVKAYASSSIKNEESRRTFNENSCDLFTAITDTEMCVRYTKQINNLTRKKKQNYESKTVDLDDAPTAL